MDELIKIDPEYASIVHINNKKRLVRALEIFGITGKAPSENFDEQKNNPTKVLDLFTIRLDWERRSLIKRIEHRLDQMLVSGWVAEVEGLLKLQKEKSSLFPALNSIGYEQIQSYLENDIDFDKMKETIFVKTRQFAKRQSQWFNKEDIELTLKMDTLKKDEVAQILCDLFKTMI
jgi:tRNA dimethylallyltransferase